MIGQKQLLNYIDSLIDDGIFPQFVIISGPRGCGKKTMAEYIAKKVSKVHWTLEANSIANIRQMIQMSYNNYQSTLCIIPEGDTLSIPAQNAILKIIEEPPKNTYFIMTVRDINYVLNTIKSRAFLLFMDSYSTKELLEMMEEEYAEYCEVPGDYIILKQTDLNEFIQFVDKVKENIGTAPLSNIFKIADSISFKVDEPGYDIEMFFKLFIHQCMKENSRIYTLMALESSKYLRLLNQKNVDKSMLFTNWILDIRDVWRTYHLCK